MNLFFEMMEHERYQPSLHAVGSQFRVGKTEKAVTQIMILMSDCTIQLS